MDRFVGRWRVWKRVVWGPVLAVLGPVFVLSSAFVLIRDAVLPVVLSRQDAETWHQALAPGLHFPWYVWAIGGLVGLLIIILEGAYRVVTRLERSNQTDLDELRTEVAGLRRQLGQQPARIDMHHYIEFPRARVVRRVISWIRREAAVFGGQVGPTRGIQIDGASNNVVTNNRIETGEEQGQG